MQDVISRGKERKAHLTGDVDVSDDAYDGHNNFNYCKP